MRIVLLGPPDAGRKDWAKKFDLPSTISPEEMMKANGLTGAIGAFSDYRTELYLASIRASNQVALDDHVFIHSPLDSYVNVVSRVNMQEEANLLDDGWMWTLMATGTMLKDSMKYDKIYRITKDSYEDDWDKLVDNAIDVVLGEIDVKVEAIEDADFG